MSDYPVIGYDSNTLPRLKLVPVPCLYDVDPGKVFPGSPHLKKSTNGPPKSTSVGKVVSHNKKSYCQHSLLTDTFI